MIRPRSKRVSFHQEVTVKEFIKKHGNSSLESDISSPDLYRAPINHCGADVEEPGVSEDSNMMDLTDPYIANTDLSHGRSSDDSNMDLTDTSCSPSPAPGEITMMINRDNMDYSCHDSSAIIGDITEVVRSKVVSKACVGDNLNMTMDTTLRLSNKNIDFLAKKILPVNAKINTTVDVSHNDSNLLNESENSTVRRSLRLARRSNDEADTSDFRTPQINLVKTKKKGGSHSSRSKQKKNVSLLSGANSNVSKSYSNVSKMSSINLLENSDGSSNISLLSVNDSISEKQAAEKLEKSKKLIELRDDKLAKLKRVQIELEEGREKVKELEDQIKAARQTRPHPFTPELMGILGAAYGGS